MPKAKAKAKAKARAKGQATAESPGAGEARRRGQQPKRTREDLTAETAPREPAVSTSAAGGHAADGTPPGSEGHGPEVIETPPKRLRYRQKGPETTPSVSTPNTEPSQEMDPDQPTELEAASQRKQRVMSGMEQTRNRWIRRQVAEMKQMPSSSWSEAMQTAAAGNNYQAVRAIFRTTYAKLPLRDRLAEAQATLAEAQTAQNISRGEDIYMYLDYLKELEQAGVPVDEAREDVRRGPGPGRPEGSRNKKTARPVWWKGYMMLMTFVSFQWGLVPQGVVDFPAMWKTDAEVVGVCAALRPTAWFQALREKATHWLKVFRTNHGFTNWSWSFELCLDTWRKSQKLLVHLHVFVNRETWAQLHGDSDDLKFLGTYPYSDGRILNGGWDPEDFKNPHRGLEPYAIPKMEAAAGHAYNLMPKKGQIECLGNKELFTNWAVNPEWITRHLQAGWAFFLRGIR